MQHLCFISPQFSKAQRWVGSAGARLLPNFSPLGPTQLLSLRFLIILFILFIPLSALDITLQFMLVNLSLFVSCDHKLI